MKTRLARAELTLKLLDEGRFPRLDAFLFGGTSDFRVVNDRFPFDDGTAASTVNDTEMVASDSRFIFHCTRQGGSPRFTVFYEKDLVEREPTLVALTYQSLVTATYAAIGLDVGAFAVPHGKHLRKEDD